jgi:hypothetical protein
MSGPSRSWLEWSVAGRALDGEELSGDAWGTFGPEARTTFAVVDGAGHGGPANRAALRALESIGDAVGKSDGEELGRVMRDCHAALVGTRGAAVAILRLDMEQRKATFCGVGNVALRVHPPRRNCGVSLPGTVGYRLPTVRVFEADLILGDLWWMWTDGLSARTLPDRYRLDPPHLAAQRALQDFGSRADDATVMVIRVASLGGAATGAG